MKWSWDVGLTVYLNQYFLSGVEPNELELAKIWVGLFYTFLCNEIGVSVCASECVCVRGSELCMAFQYSVSIQQGVMLLHCRRRCTDMCWVCRHTLHTAMSVSLF